MSFNRPIGKVSKVTRPGAAFGRSEMAAGTFSGCTVPQTPCAMKLRSSCKLRTLARSSSSFCVRFLPRYLALKTPNISPFGLASRRAVINFPSSSLKSRNCQIRSSSAASNFDQPTMIRARGSFTASKTVCSNRWSARNGFTGGFCAIFVAYCLRGVGVASRCGLARISLSLSSEILRRTSYATLIASR